jgi:hypothetical protein
MGQAGLLTMRIVVQFRFPGSSVLKTPANLRGSRCGSPPSGQLFDRSSNFCPIELAGWERMT